MMPLWLLNAWRWLNGEPRIIARVRAGGGESVQLNTRLEPWAFKYVRSTRRIQVYDHLFPTHEELDSLELALSRGPDEASLPGFPVNERTQVVTNGKLLILLIQMARRAPLPHVEVEDDGPAGVA